MQTESVAKWRQVETGADENPTPGAAPAAPTTSGAQSMKEILGESRRNKLLNAECEIG